MLGQGHHAKRALPELAYKFVRVHSACSPEALLFEDLFMPLSELLCFFEENGALLRGGRDQKETESGVHLVLACGTRLAAVNRRGI